MNRDSASQAVAQFRGRIENLVSFGQSKNWRAERDILENDLREFVETAFESDSRDYEILDEAVNYSTSAWNSWPELVELATSWNDALVVIEHRLEQDQSRLKAGKSDEIVIDPGTPYSAYVALREIVRSAKAGLLMVDPYVGSDLYPLLTNAASGVRSRILTWKSRTPPDFTTEAAKFETEHGLPIEVRWGSEDFHDRFLMADDRLFMSGGSFKDLGKKLSFLTEVRSVKEILVAELEKRWLSGTNA